MNWQSLSGVDAAVLVFARTFLPDPLILFVFVGALTSLLLVSVVATQLPQLLGVFVVHMVLGYLVYRLRVRQLAARGTELRTKLRQLADHE